jgi:hypothetical protein
MGEDERLPASLEAKHRERSAHHDQHRRSRRSTARRSFLAPREMSLPRKMRTFFDGFPPAKHVAKRKGRAK